MRLLTPALKYEIGIFCLPIIVYFFDSYYYYSKRKVIKSSICARGICAHWPWQLPGIASKKTWRSTKKKHPNCLLKNWILSLFFTFSDHVAIHSIDHLYTYIFFPGYIMLSEWQLWMTYCDRSYLFSCIVGNVDVGIWKGTSSQWHSHSILFSHIDVAWKLAERDNHFKV